MNRRQFVVSLGAAAAVPSLSQAQKPPNLLFIMADQFRFDALACAGNRVVQTPNLDKLAQDGARFENAMCACPVCVPSRTGMLTGKSMANTSVGGNVAAQDDKLDVGPTFDNILHDRGYKSQYYGKWHVPYKAARTYDNKVADVPAEHRDFVAYIDRNVPKRKPAKGELNSPMYMRPYTASPVDGHYADAQAGIDPGNYTQQDQFGWIHVPKEHSLAAFPTDQVIHALDEMKDGPFSLTCSIGPPHPPFLNVEPYWGMYPWTDMPVPRTLAPDARWGPYRERAEGMKFYHDEERVKRFMSIYYGMVREVDDQVGRLLRRVDELGLRDNTLVIFTADHGEMMGSHGLVSKMVLYEEAVHVPLLMRMPRTIKPGTVAHDVVSGMDLFSTILESLGTPAPPRDGDSLRPLLTGTGKAGPDYRVSEWGVRNQPSFMVRTREWKLLMADSPESRGHDALFDLRNDPYEMRNLLGDPTDRQVVNARAAEMKERLLAWLGKVHSPVLDAVKQRRPQAG
jgi:choline-sulfatase